MKYSVAVIALLGLTNEANAVSIQRHHHHAHHDIQMVGTHGDEPLDNKADAAPEKADAAAPEKADAAAPAKEEADPKSPEAVEKR